MEKDNLFVNLPDIQKDISEDDYKERSKYREYYIDLISSSLTNPPTDNIYEIHHIIPRCIGGSDEESNLVKLTIKSHILVHYYLCKMYPENTKLVYALNITLRSKNKQQLLDEFNLEEVTKMREVWISYTKTKEFSEKMRLVNTGIKRSEETRKRDSESKKGAKNGMFGKKLSPEHKEALINSIKGEKNVNFGKIFTEEEKLKLSVNCGGKVVVGPDNTEYTSIRWAVKKTGIPRTTLRSWIKQNKNGWSFKSPKTN